jgi:hypothetical protein
MQNQVATDSYGIPVAISEQMKEKCHKYLKQRPDMEYYIVPQVFGDGNVLIDFYYRAQVGYLSQGYLAFIDSKKWDDDRYKMHDEVEEYLKNNVGSISPEDFAQDKHEDGLDCCINNNNYYCPLHEKEFWEWMKDQFPMVWDEYGGVSYYDEVILKEF